MSHFTVDGTLIEAWANQMSFRPKESPPEPGRYTPDSPESLGYKK
jgi:hypothetical protein